MKVDKQHYRTIWAAPDSREVHIIDQTQLPFAFEVLRLSSCAHITQAIASMQVRGAPLIGAAAAYGVALAALEQVTDAHLQQAGAQLIASRPTAVNLAWAVQRMLGVLLPLPLAARLDAAWHEAEMIANEDVAQNQQIAQHGLGLIQQLSLQKQQAGEGVDALSNSHALLKGLSKKINILTHCNAGWLATVDYGTALAPIYAAFDAGLDVHVWVDETRPRNQGSSLTAWELAQHGVPHTVIADNTGGYLMQQGLVDMVIVGADRVTKDGDVCNKIGTYLKALAAHDNGVPFYAAVPSPTIDWQINAAAIEIEARSADEVAYMRGLSANGTLQTVRVIPENSPAFNPAFDVTPARLVTGIITEKGVFASHNL